MKESSEAAYPFQTGFGNNLPQVLYPSSLSGNKTSSNMQVQFAVHLDGVNKAYENNGIPQQILNNFSMKVATGEIYCLLGNTGAGKSTCMQCIVGLKTWDSGSIQIFGSSRCKSGDSTHIGNKIGYMPQELALYDHLTIKETVRYYGKLFGVSNEIIEKRWLELAVLLRLPLTNSKQIKYLSGGQKRRASLALALVHKPQLLVLDEPTVGLDPLLRKSIWEHLYELINQHNTTVIITTHYIEETRFSNKIGIIRNGRMLVEASPESLLTTHKANLLQDAILTICKQDQLHQDTKEKKNCISCIPQESNEIVFECNGRISPKSFIDLPDQFSEKGKVDFCGFLKKNPDEYHLPYFADNGKGNLVDAGSTQEEICTCQKLHNRLRKSATRTLSLSFVMWIYLIRQPIFAFILVFLPAIQLLMTYHVVGKEPTGLSVGVVNYEALSFFPQEEAQICANVSTTLMPATCEFSLLSCHLLNILAASGKLNLIHFHMKQVAEESLQEGSLFGYITFPQNYSDNLVNRFMIGKFASDNSTLEESKISITLDKSHYLAYHLILKEVADSIENLSINLDAACGYDHRYNEIPLLFQEPVFGSLDGSHQESIIPAIVAQILFEIMYGIAPMILIKDLKQGTFSRSTLAGLRYSEFMLGIFVTMSPILMLQSCSCFVILQYCFYFQVKGSFLLFLFLCFLAGLCGQGFGIFIGILVKSEFAVIVSAIMVVPIIMTCSGTLWPLEAHPFYLTVIYFIFPSAPIISSLRSVVNRGVGMAHLLVWPGLVNTIVWSVAFWLLSIWGFRRMAKSS